MSKDILLVDDSSADAELTRRALYQAQPEHTLHHVCDGVEAMEFLRQEGKFTAAPRPSFILLDLNMPRMDGRAVLQELKDDDSLRKIPVVILSTSNHDSDIHSAYELHANAYVVKPSELKQFFLTIQKINDFWGAVVAIPTS